MHKKFLDILIASPQTSSHIKQYLASCEAGIKLIHLSGKSGIDVCRVYTVVIDDLIKTIFSAQCVELNCRNSTAIVAIGGYGRGELNLRSDIDLMLLYKGKMSPVLEELNRRVLYMLWDTGLDIGFSIRSIDESIRLAKEDLKTMTALLDRRFIFGDAPLYEELDDCIKKKLFGKSNSSEFVRQKLEENSVRREHYGGSVYILEPNVKEGEGGLRDLHTAVWIIKANEGLSVEPFSTGLIRDDEKKHLTASVDFLLWVRNDLHFNSSRKTDQLTFDHQERIAAAFNLESDMDGHGLPVEKFMRHYYRHASNISNYSELMISRSLYRGRKKPRFFWPKKRVKIDKDYEIADGLLSLKNTKCFENDTAAPFRAFEYSLAFDVEIDQSLKDRILDFLTSQASASDGSFATSPQANESFFKILKNKNSHKALSEMHKLKFLEKYIPEFADITCRVQHDLYHVYTVDIHSIFSVRELERLYGEYKGEFPVLSAILEETANPAILKLAVLAHDIGKACGKGHAEKGAELIPGICSRLNMPEDDAKLVEFLVRNHLLLADTAQYRDIHDEKLVLEFAKRVGDTERLGLLYLLTFADVRAVGPEVWTKWKGALFQELYFKASSVLERGSFEVEEMAPRLERIKADTKELLAPQAIDAGYVDDYFMLLPQRYFFYNSPEAIARHVQIVKSFSAQKQYILSVRQEAQRQYTELTICTHDVHGLFSWITGVMAANGINILGAQINTLKNGIVLDALQVINSAGEMVNEEHKLKKIESDLSDVIAGRVKVANLVKKQRRPSILDKKAKPRVPTRVLVDNDVSDAHTVLEIHTQNRIGLLYDITSTLSKLGLYIYISKITTKGDEAADIFYIKDIFGQKVFFDKKLKELLDTLYGALDKESADSSK